MFPTKSDIRGILRSLVIGNIPRKLSHRDKKVKSIPRGWGPEAWGVAMTEHTKGHLVGSTEQQLPGAAPLGVMDPIGK